MTDTPADPTDEGTERTVLQLDARRREMLELMGVRLWWPQANAAVPPAPPAQARSAPTARPVRDEAHEEPQQAMSPIARPLQTPVQERPAVRPAPASPAAAPAPATSIAGRAANPRAASEGLLADAPRLLYGQAGARGWLIVADLPPDMLGSYPDPLSGDEGKLLANMLRALRLDAGEQPVHLLRVHRGSPGAASGDDAPQPLEQVLACACGPLAPAVVLALGPLAAQALLQRQGPIGKLRGEVQPLPEGPLAGIPAMASYPLTYLLRNGADKAKAWADLCQAAAAQAAR